MLSKGKLYSYVLVLSQFTCISLLIFLNPLMFTTTLPLLFFCIGVGLFIYIVYDVKTLNFNIIPEIKENASLITTGAYKYIRHPMYFAVIITMLSPLSTAFDFTNIAICILLILTLFLKAKKEEILWSKESAEYTHYMQNTKMIIPFII